MLLFFLFLLPVQNLTDSSSRSLLLLFLLFLRDARFNILLDEISTEEVLGCFVLLLLLGGREREVIDHSDLRLLGLTRFGSLFSLVKLIKVEWGHRGLRPQLLILFEDKIPICAHLHHVVDASSVTGSRPEYRLLLGGSPWSPNLNI